MTSYPLSLTLTSADGDELTGDCKLIELSNEHIGLSGQHRKTITLELAPYGLILNDTKSRE